MKSILDEIKGEQPLSTLEYINELERIVRKLEHDLDKEANISFSVEGQLHDLKDKCEKYKQAWLDVYNSDDQVGIDKVYTIEYTVVDIEYSSIRVSDKAFNSYREASKYLINDGFVPFLAFKELNFSKINEDEFYDEEVIAKVIELDVI